MPYYFQMIELEPTGPSLAESIFGNSIQPQNSEALGVLHESLVTVIAYFEKAWKFRSPGQQACTYGALSAADVAYMLVIRSQILNVVSKFHYDMTFPQLIRKASVAADCTSSDNPDKEY